VYWHFEHIELTLLRRILHLDKNSHKPSN
jgi:hypothetical protein